jgi:hypothetical protein
VSPNDEPCDHPATVHCENCGRWFCDAHAEDEEWHRSYFRLETKAAKLICETKAQKDIGTLDVRNKAKAAVKWCEYATIHEKQVGGKPWAYLLIPHDAVNEAKTVQGLAAAFTLKTPEVAVKV